MVMIVVRVTSQYSTTLAFALLPPYKLIYNVVNKIHRISIMLAVLYAIGYRINIRIYDIKFLTDISLIHMYIYIYKFLLAYDGHLC